MHQEFIVEYNFKHIPAIILKTVSQFVNIAQIEK